MTDYEPKYHESTDVKSGARRPIATDGGIVVAQDDAEILEEEVDEDVADDRADRERPDDCSCGVGFDELPCWACYAAGFDTPNTDAEEGSDA